MTSLLLCLFTFHWGFDKVDQVEEVDVDVDVHQVPNSKADTKDLLGKFSELKHLC